MTPTQTRLIAAMRQAIADGTWTAISGGTIRWTRQVPTPGNFLVSPDEFARRRGFGCWCEPTHTQMLFLTVVAADTRPWSIILGSSAASWLGRTDSPLTFKRAFEVLADPAAEFTS